MKVFLSWSGEKSQSVANALAAWLSQVIQAVEPWLSGEIAKGSRWGPEITANLEKSKVGIVCLTSDNLDARWILFEAGALSKTTDAYVCTFLVDIRPADVEEPLSQFQHTQAERGDVKRLITTINERVHDTGEKPLAPNILDEVFDTNWPKLEAKLAEIRQRSLADPPAQRSDRELLEEILELVRDQKRASEASPVFFDNRMFGPPKRRLPSTDITLQKLDFILKKIAGLQVDGPAASATSESTESDPADT